MADESSSTTRQTSEDSNADAEFECDASFDESWAPITHSYSLDVYEHHPVADPDNPPMKVDFEAKSLTSFLPQPAELEALTILNPLQVDAMRRVVQKSMKLSSEALPLLTKRVAAWGGTDDDIRKTLLYVRDQAPIIIHITPVEVLHLLVKDTHYRNQFETSTSHGSTDLNARRSWEDRLFDSVYATSEPFDRVKYGCLNVVNDICGVKAATQYGDSYLWLKHVRLRTSFSDRDSSCADSGVSCCEYYAHVLQGYSDAELRAVMDVATGKVPSNDSAVISQYKEIQIHGPVRLDKDVKALVLNHKYRGNAQMEKTAEEFCAKHGCELMWMPAP